MNDTASLAIAEDMLLFLATAGVVAPLFVRLRISPVLGYLLAGVALGPFGISKLVRALFGLDWKGFADVESIDRVAAFGVVVLLFTMGLELSFERIKSMRRMVFGLGFAQVIISTTLVAGGAFALGLSWKAALIVGAALSMSSTAMVIPVLAEAKRLNRVVGRASFAVLLFQDLAVAPLLFAVAWPAGGGLALLAAFAPAALALGAVILGGRLLLRPLFHSVARTQSPEFFMAACLLVVLGASVIAAVSGLSMALGAFVAGSLLAETEYRREIEVTIEPFRGLLLGLFFVSIGAGLDLSLVAARPRVVFGIAFGFAAAKAAALFLLARAFGVARRPAREMALLLGPGGEFAFVLLGSAVAGGVLPADAGRIASVAAALSMMAVPHLGRLGVWLSARHARVMGIQEETPPEASEHRVIIVGFGRVGALIAEMLDMHKIPYIAADSDPVVVARARAAGRPVYFGDATRAEYLRKCGIETARALVVTMDAPRRNEDVVATARKLRPDITLVARARDADHARALYSLGVTDAVPETIEASLQLSEATLVDLGVPMGIVIASIHEKREEYRKLLTVAGAPERVRAVRRTRTRSET